MWILRHRLTFKSLPRQFVIVGTIDYTLSLNWMLNKTNYEWLSVIQWLSVINMTVCKLLYDHFF